MYFFPFKDRVVADRFAEGLAKAGAPGRPSGYLPAYKENQLTGEEIKRLLFGSTITGLFGNNDDGRQWRIDRKKDGDFTWRGPGPISSDTGKSGPEPISSDTGKSWIEGDTICRNTRRDFGVLNSARPFSEIPKAHTKVKTSISFVATLDFHPFPWSADWHKVSGPPGKKKSDFHQICRDGVGGGSMAQYKCQVCDFIYDEAKEGIRWESLPADWQCPVCCSPKKYFFRVDSAPLAEKPSTPPRRKPPQRPFRLISKERRAIRKIILQTSMRWLKPAYLFMSP